MPRLAARYHFPIRLHRGILLINFVTLCQMRPADFGQQMCTNECAVPFLENTQMKYHHTLLLIVARHMRHQMEVEKGK